MAAGHKRRCQQNFENYLQLYVPWLRSNDTEDSLTAVLSEMDLWQAASGGQRLQMNAANPEGVDDCAEDVHGEALQAGAEGRDPGEDDEEVDELQVEHFHDGKVACNPFQTDESHVCDCASRSSVHACRMELVRRQP